MTLESNPHLLKSFDDRMLFMLKYIFDNGGEQYKQLAFDSGYAYRIVAATGIEEFNRVIRALQNKDWITCKENNGAFNDSILFSRVLLTESGREEVTRTALTGAMVSLVNQSIQTGSQTMDEKINHARLLFFQAPQTMEHMRSACVTLAAVLEPLRDELSPTFTIADVSEFFLIVNRFDIRHNKASTANLEHPEQLEWVFYTLLNTINTYTKLKSRLLHL